MNIITIIFTGTLFSGFLYNHTNGLYMIHAIQPADHEYVLIDMQSTESLVDLFYKK